MANHATNVENHDQINPGREGPAVAAVLRGQDDADLFWVNFLPRAERDVILAIVDHLKNHVRITHAEIELLKQLATFHKTARLSAETLGKNPRDANALNMTKIAQGQVLALYRALGFTPNNPKRRRSSVKQVREATEEKDALTLLFEDRNAG